MPKYIPGKYRKIQPVELQDRRWPSVILDNAPIWASVDMRDGNQALFDPMNAEQKMEFFEMLTKIGFKDIEVGFPAASETEFNFIRSLIEGNKIPDDVKIGVLTQARPELIRRTVESLRGAKQAIIHLYIATSPQFREQVFNMSVEDVKETAVSCTEMIRELTRTYPDTKWTYEFSPETFSQTELPFARDICDAVAEAWGATPDHKMIINLPATLEVCTPNIYADMIEWMHRNLARRDSMILSLHPHNDRGTAVAAVEQGLMAGADRVEGCILGGGERAGNVDLVTLALNLYSQDVDPKLDFSRIEWVRSKVERLTKIPTHPRHPWAGDFVFTAFSGSHQDAIKKGFAQREERKYFEVPYFGIDPADLGREYKDIIRINSQSGKGGISYLMENVHGIIMPRPMQIEFSGVVQRYTDEKGGEVDSGVLMDLFNNHYMRSDGAFRYVSHELCQRKPGEPQRVKLTVEFDGKQITMQGEGNGVVDAAVHAFQLPINIHSFDEHSMGRGSDAAAISFIEMAVHDVPGYHFGVGVNKDTVTANIEAIVRGVNRAIEDGKIPKPQWPVASAG